MNEVTALALISGGLDSQLAAKIVIDQGVKVVGVHYDTGFIGGIDQELVAQIEANLDIELKTLTVNEEDYTQLIKYPTFDYGSGVNPCIDCRIYILKLAKQVMTDIGAKFVLTGEVLGQRPMTQNKDSLALITRESGLEDRLLRPLSAKLLPPTLPEQKGWINRHELLGIEGRSRKLQLELADQYGLEEYHQPAGGCLLTEEAFRRRVQDLFDYLGREQTSPIDLKLLKYGRHFRLSEVGKAIVGRDEEENDKLKRFLHRRWGIRLKNFPGPLTLISEGLEKNLIQTAARITARYSQGRDEEKVEVEVISEGKQDQFTVVPLSKEDPILQDLRI